MVIGEAIVNGDCLKIFAGGRIDTNTSPDLRDFIESIDRNIRQVIFDFKDVDFIGQAFADEIFRVYPTKNTRTELQYINAVTQIEKMIAHVRLQA
jgi:anti-anti-sigma regulatory factor